MEFTFKDEASKELFRSRDIEKSDSSKATPSFTQDDIHDLYQELINTEKEESTLKNVALEEVSKVEIIEEVNELEPQKDSNQDLTLLHKTISSIESKQDLVLKILTHIESLTINKTQTKDIKQDELSRLNLSLNSFSKKLVIVSLTSTEKEIQELLLVLNMISDYLLSNSFYIFTLEKSPIKKALISIRNLGMDKKINKSSMETEDLLMEIDKISKMEIFQQSYYYSRLMLNKGLLLQSIVLLNEAISIYIVETVKRFSEDINKYTSIYGEENKHQLYAQAKDFFICLFPVKNETKKKENILALFPHHKYPKEIDHTIANKFKRIYSTGQNKGDCGLFEKYSYIIARVRRIRNNLAHGNMEFDFRDLKKEMFEIIIDFNYLTIEKNIFKYKIKGTEA